MRKRYSSLLNSALASTKAACFAKKLKRFLIESTTPLRIGAMPVRKVSIQCQNDATYRSRRCSLQWFALKRMSESIAMSRTVMSESAMSAASSSM